MFWSVSTLTRTDAQTRTVAALRLEGNDLEIGNLTLRRAEQDFLLHKDLANADRVREGLNETQNRAEALARDPRAAFLAGPVERILQGMKAYREEFEIMVAAQQRAGLTESDGLQGALRQAVHAMEREVTAENDDALMVPLLMMRRYEKDYLLRGYPSLLEKVREQGRVFMDRLNHSTLNGQRQAELSRQIETYLGALAAMIEADQNVRASLVRLGAIYADFSPAFQALRTKAIEADSAVQARGKETETQVIVLSLALVGASVPLFLLVSLLIARSVVRPVRAITQVMDTLSHGQKEVSVPYTNGHDEIAVMARSIQVFKENLLQSERLEKEVRAGQERELYRSRERDRLIQEFAALMDQTMSRVKASVEGVQTNAHAVRQAADTASRDSSTVSTAAEEAANAIDTMAQAAEELGTATIEISQRIQESTRYTAVAVNEALNADKTIEQLAASARTIEEILTLIETIAGQTNLLALNATIEAARAGEMGKGFAVVAGEVKALSVQTAKATQDIASQIREIQTSTRHSVEAIRAVSGAIRQVDGVVSSIAAAVEEQSAATQAIVQTVQQAAAENRAVTQTMGDVSAAARSTGELATSMFHVARDLGDAEANLGRDVGSFLGNVQAV
ncbi:methyl-accepting chemotaxis protein [Pararhodospirillum oryzae]|uniref:Methyl-accepting chemotaxis protein n=1 Tax=Pararhodospirillum oryzae TaxID=478448 RepID=A0A512H888_9PROT|nr:methyl-accepting chemotaxis protein [Pararhodospirillum oryzae]